MTIKQASDKGKLDDLQLVIDEFEVNEILSYLGKRNFARRRNIDGLFVGQANGDYTRVYGFRGCIPYHEKELVLIPKKYQRTIDRIVYPVNSKYGAPMGRQGKGDKPGGKVFDTPVILNEGYDKGGAYWGLPNNLRVKYTADLSYVQFYRK